MNRIMDVYNPVGMDVEFPAIDNTGKFIIGEKVLDGVLKSRCTGYSPAGNTNSTVLDGAAIEINPAPSHCRAFLMENVGYVFADLFKQGINLSVKQTEMIPKDQFAEMHPDNKIFGCKPDTNRYTGENKIKVNPKRVRTRTFGGHIHLGRNYFHGGTVNSDFLNPELVIPLMDILVGNTSILVEPKNNRRKIYGKAGDYRTPSHGIEYRTLSNFWMKHHTISCLFLELARMSGCIVADFLNGNTTLYNKLMEIPTNDIVNAINNQDKGLATQNYMIVKNILKDYSYTKLGYGGFSRVFKFLEYVSVYGFNKFFTDTHFSNWKNVGDTHCSGLGEMIDAFEAAQTNKQTSYDFYVDKDFVVNYDAINEAEKTYA